MKASCHESTAVPARCLLVGAIFSRRLPAINSSPCTTSLMATCSYLPRSVSELRRLITVVYGRYLARQPANTGTTSPPPHRLLPGNDNPPAARPGSTTLGPRYWKTMCVYMRHVLVCDGNYSRLLAMIGGAGGAQRPSPVWAGSFPSATPDGHTHPDIVLIHPFFVISEKCPSYRSDAELCTMVFWTEGPDGPVRIRYEDFLIHFTDPEYQERHGNIAVAACRDLGSVEILNNGLNHCPYCGPVVWRR
ncbi:hypothetical protein VTK73DRAFT_9209 [Phialemonium thermophilum]|uniref:Uncharacterized protein n=1 Tax=Phialemonium thermophilum TaxID=223376 RepID=A0ABR3W3Q9_9PEZI